MRRSGAVLAVGLVALAACSAGGRADVTAERSVRTSAEPAAAVEQFDPDVVAGPDDLPLPGLLDTTDEQLPDDPAVRTGTLGNGLRYYVRSNDNPGAKAELRLAVDAGSVDETGPSTGVAHFVEHMLFNGTERFPENQLISTLRSFGAAFGADVNASTGFDSTVYQLTVPNDDETVQLGLTVLEQWLSHATIDDDQVVAERGVVLDEWRLRTQSTSGRLFAAAAPMFLGGTPYDGRAPIGDEASIAAMPTDELRDYYDRYYRPDNAAVVVVGDIDVAAVEAEIERLFGPATDRSGAGADDSAGDEYRFGPDLEPDALVHPDPDQRTVDVEVTFPLGVEPPASTAGIRASLLDEIAFDVLVRRLDDDVVAGRAPFDEIAHGSNSFVAGLDAPGLYAITDADRATDALLALLDEIERARRFGFDRAEVDVAVEAIRARSRSRYDGRDSTQDRVYADAYVDDFLLGVGFPAIDTEYAAVTALLDGITPEAVDLRYRTRLANTAPHVIVSTPAELADRMPSEDELLALVAARYERSLDPRETGRELPDVLMTAPAPVEPTSVSSVVEDGDLLFDPVRVEFPNGVTVIVNRNDIVEGRVFFEAASRGGSSLVADGDVVDALYATDVVTASGLGEFDAAEVDRILAGRDVLLDASLGPYSEHFGGSAATTDLEVLFQLLHLSMTDPRVDDSAFRQIVNGVRPLVDDPASDAGLAATDALLDARYPGELRYAVLPTPEQFETLDPDGVRRVWADRFQHVDDWTFVLSGDVDVDLAIGLAGAYLGSLPAADAETPVDVEDPPPPGVVTSTVTAGTGDTASSTALYTAPVDDITAELVATADVVTELLSARLIDVVRERLGDSYSPSAVSYVTVDPDPVVETYVSTTGSPDRIDAIAELVAAEIADLVRSGPSAEELGNAFAQVAERYRFVDNWQFVDALLQSELEPAWELGDIRDRPAALQTLDEADVRDYLARYLPLDQYIQVTVTPR